MTAGILYTRQLFKNDLMLNVENTEQSEFVGECKCCMSRSISFLCDQCASAFRKHQIIPPKNDDEYDWCIWNVDDHIQNKIRKEICNNNI